MIEIELSRIVIDESKTEQAIVLKEKRGSRCFPVIIGMSEAIAIRAYAGGARMARPLAHDLMHSVITALGARMQCMVITSLKADTFFACVQLTPSHGPEIHIDSRPSDAIALALRCGAPLYAEEAVFAALAQT